MFARLLQIALAFWAGSLWTICGIVAPSLFAIVPDRHLAGEIAGHFFRVESWLGLALGGIVLTLLSRIDSTRNNPNYALTVVTTAGPVSNEVALRPLMDSALAAGDTQKFGLLHGGGAFLFIFACVTVLILLWRTNSDNRL